MTSRERVIRCLQFNYPDRAPRELWHLPGVPALRKKELEELVTRYPMDFWVPPLPYATGKRTAGVPNTIGNYTDEWGCVWTVAEEGVVGEVKGHPLIGWDAHSAFEAPWELFEGIDFAGINRQCETTDLFVRASTCVRLFERMQFLRGTENTYLDLALLSSDFFRLRDLVHEFFLHEIRLWARTKVDAIAFIDDWGSQNHLLVDPELWRRVFKPLYREYCDTIKAAGKYVFFHTDGNVESIMDDFLEIGVDAINTQLFCMDIEGLAQRFKGRMTFWGEICRQSVLPFGTVADVHRAVCRVRRAFDDGRGGLIAQCEWGTADPAENIAAVYEAWGSTTY